MTSKKITMTTADDANGPPVTMFKSLAVALKDLEPYIRNGRHLQVGDEFKEFGGLRSRELLGNWLLCVVGNYFSGRDRYTFASDPLGGDGLIVDKTTELCLQTEHVFEPRSSRLRTTVDKSLPFGLGDEQRLTQVLLNLVGNAIKFTDAGEVSIVAGARNGHFAVSVTDTGPGIPIDQQGRIFDQFHQVDSSLTKAKGGTGLGLAIAKQIVEMHGGRIWVVSTPGKGSTFQMELPTRAEFRKLAPGGAA